MRGRMTLGAGVLLVAGWTARREALLGESRFGLHLNGPGNIGTLRLVVDAAPGDASRPPGDVPAFCRARSTSGAIGSMQITRPSSIRCRMSSAGYPVPHATLSTTARGGSARSRRIIRPNRSVQTGRISSS